MLIELVKYKFQQFSRSNLANIFNIFTEAHKSRRKRGESMESIPSSSITNKRKYSIPGLSQTEREWGTGGEKIFKII
jgi:hypothetical protein